MNVFGIKEVGIDLGTSSVLIYQKGKGVVLREPAVVAVDVQKGTAIAVGYKAQRMLGRTPEHIKAVRPLRDGVISDYELTSKMLREFLRKAIKPGLLGYHAIACVPSGVTEVEKRAVIDAVTQAGASRVRIIEEPVAAALGAGLEIARPNGSMVVDIGGGTTDIAILSLNGIVVRESIKIAGDKFDEAIVKYVKKKYNLLIGERTAEEIKLQIGCVLPMAEERACEVRGRCLITALPKTIELTTTEMAEATIETAMQIAEAVYSVLERTKPELISDISRNGLVLTGGGSLIWGLDILLKQRTGIEATIAEDAISCVAAGTGKALDYIDSLPDERQRRKIIYS